MRSIIVAALLCWAGMGPMWAQPSGSSVAPDTGVVPPSSAHEGSESAAQLQGKVTAIEKHFDATDLSGKLAVIEGLSAQVGPRDGPLLQRAVEYLVSNFGELRGEQAADELGTKAAGLIETIHYAPAAEPLWQLFQFSDNRQVRLTAIGAIASIAHGNADVVNKMNHWLAGQNLLFQTGAQVDPKMVDACVRALGELMDGSSFAVLFATMGVGYGQPVTGDAHHALEKLKGNRGKQYLQVVESGRLSDREVALRMAIADEKLTAPEKGAIATAALKAALGAQTAGKGSVADIATLRFRSVGELGTLQWTPAADLVLENFNRAASEYRQGAIAAKDLIESANALAAMGTHEAAVRLSLYLDLINSMTDKGRPFDQSVTLAIIRDLGKLGDPVAYQNLLTVGYLRYPDSIKTAAREAVRNIED